MNENPTLIESIVQKSKCILLPGGRDYRHCVSVFENTFNMQVPPFPERTLSVESDGRRYVKVKSRDIPNLVRQGFADLGIAYTDVCIERITFSDSVTYEKIGDDACLKLSLLSPKGQKDEIESRLYAKEKPIIVATAYPHLLEKYLNDADYRGEKLNIVLSSLVPSGSVEAMVVLGVADAVVDVVNTGITAEANGLSAKPLTDIFPAIVYRK